MSVQLNTNSNNKILFTNKKESKQSSGNHKKNIKINIGTPATIITLGTVGGMLMFSKGTQKAMSKFLKHIKNITEEKLKRSTLKKDNKNDFYRTANKNLTSFIKKTESINNINSFKDILFMKFMFKYKPTQKLHQTITDYFEKISRKTVYKSYEKTEDSLKNMNKIFDELDDYILKHSSNEIVIHKGDKYTHKEFVERAQKHRKNVTQAIEKFISKKSIDERYDYINKSTSTLYSTFWDTYFKDFSLKNNKFKSKEIWQTFVAAEQIKNDKAYMAKELSDLRYSITYNKDDKINLIQKYIENIDEAIPAYDKKGIEIINRLKWFNKYSDGFQYNKAYFLKELTELEEHKIPVKTNKNITSSQEECINTHIQAIRKLMDDNSRGELRDMLAVYYKIAPFELTKSGGYTSVKNTMKSFDKSVELEGEEFFDKMRDLKLGSAPTDILTLFLSFIALSFGFGFAKDKDERISIMLKSGIPLMGGIASTMYATAKLVSGGKSIAFGLLSGIVLNQLGKITDKLRLKYKDSIKI